MQNFYSYVTKASCRRLCIANTLQNMFSILELPTNKTDPRNIKLIATVAQLVIVRFHIHYFRVTYNSIHILLDW